MISDSFALYTLCFSLFCIPTAAQSIYSYCTCFLFHLASLSHFLQACNFIASTDFLHFFYIFYASLPVYYKPWCFTRLRAYIYNLVTCISCILNCFCSDRKGVPLLAAGMRYVRTHTFMHAKRATRARIKYLGTGCKDMRRLQQNTN